MRHRRRCAGPRPRLSARRANHLAFADRAYESAEASPFEFPEDVYDALLKLERLASQWARPAGIGGRDLGHLAAELGLDWKADVSQTARNKHERHYTYTWDDEKRTMGLHVRLGSGSGAGRIARIYLDKYEPADPERRRLIVAHVGRKLRDTTTRATRGHRAFRQRLLSRPRRCRVHDC